MLHRFWMHGGQGCVGRSGAARGFGGFIAGFMEGTGRGGQGFRMGRKLGAGDLQLIVLALLAEKPRHGYEIIKALEERSKGFYSPSPGMVYPALTYLEEIGFTTVEADAGKKLYSITESGRAHLDENRAAADAMLAQLSRIGEKMERVRQVFAGEEPTGETGEFGSTSLRKARHELKAALIAKIHASPEEHRRIAEILKRAADEIRRKVGPSKE